MSTVLPLLDLEEFSARLESALGVGLSEDVKSRLWIHYEELRRWSPGLSLVGRGTAVDVVARHYAESLEALPLLDRGVRVVDVGSGAGFPGWALAAARPDLEVTLVESRHRKALFLESATRKAALSCGVLNARVGDSLPEGFPESVDILTVRAVRLDIPEWGVLMARMARGGRILRWVGPSAPLPPAGWCAGRQVRISRSQREVQELLLCEGRGVEQ